MINKVVGVDAFEGLGGVVQDFDEDGLLGGYELPCEERLDRPVAKWRDVGDGRLLEPRDLPYRSQDDGLATRRSRVLGLLVRPRDTQHFHLYERLVLLLLLLLMMLLLPLGHSLGCSGDCLGLCGKGRLERVAWELLGRRQCVLERDGTIFGG